MSEQTTTWPSRVVDHENQGWYLTQDAGRNLIYSAGYRRQDLPERYRDELTATRGPLRPVLPITDADYGEMRRLFAAAGRKTITTLAAAVETVFDQLRESQGGLANAGSFAYAMRTLKAGREGSWEAEALDNVMWFGNELNLAPAPGKKIRNTMGNDARRAAGPSRRVDVAVRGELAAMLTRWVTGPERYTEVAETLAAVVSRYADDKAGRDGWREVADQWLQPGQLQRVGETGPFVACYRLLYSLSEHFNPDLI